MQAGMVRRAEAVATGAGRLHLAGLRHAKAARLAADESGVDRFIRREQQIRPTRFPRMLRRQEPGNAAREQSDSSGDAIVHDVGAGKHLLVPAQLQSVPLAPALNV